jgi:short-subunit dehydrogenase
MSLNRYPQGINVLIVGASGGIGLAFTRQLLAEDKVDRLFATHRESSPMADLSQLKQEYPEKLALLSLDITKESEISAITTKIGEEVKRLHLVINCVGILHDGDFQPEKSLRQIQPENLLRYFEINSIGKKTIISKIYRSKMVSH